MNTRKPSIQVRLVSEYEVILLVLTLHLSLIILTAFRALQVAYLWLLLPALVFGLVRSWQRFVSLNRAESIRAVYVDASDRTAVLLGSGDRRAARIHACHLYERGVLICLAIDGLGLASTVVIGRRSASARQLRHWKTRMRQLPVSPEPTTGA